MRSIEEIYQEHKLMPNLKEHMYRVAAVASIICDNFKENLDKEKIIEACLLHDMGNIIKFDLNYFPEFTKPEGVEYWSDIQKEYKERYGNDEHHATIAISKELNVSQRVLGLIDDFGFRKACERVQGTDIEAKICFYSDMRVGPFSVFSIEERFIDGEKRYSHRKFRIEEQEYRECIREVERQIFAKSKIKPEDITNEQVDMITKELKGFVIK